MPGGKTCKDGKNKLSGTIPTSIYNLHGNLPRDLGGLIPVTISGVSSLSLLVLGLNSFTGNVEDNDLSFFFPLASNTSFEVFSANDNCVGGALPEIVSNFSAKLRFMTFGNIPKLRFQALSFEWNKLTGIIPTSTVQQTSPYLMHSSARHVSNQLLLYVAVAASVSSAVPSILVSS
ncbi:hypothetical protein OIU76_012557 [Salix suchowensis]|nr:hypothetical protein OIU76_012557 [Salix suchowensis]